MLPEQQHRSAQTHKKSQEQTQMVCVFTFSRETSQIRRAHIRERASESAKETWTWLRAVPCRRDRAAIRKFFFWLLACRQATVKLSLM
jgi:predicted dithiol-disulfide oxidoreductase (DUF899 family)